MDSTVLYTYYSDHLSILNIWDFNIYFFLRKSHTISYNFAGHNATEGVPEVHVEDGVDDGVQGGVDVPQPRDELDALEEEEKFMGIHLPVRYIDLL